MSRSTRIQSVAVVGAGISGVCTAAHLLKEGMEVVLYERGATSGGVWHYDARAAPDPAYPSETPSAGDYEQLAAGPCGTPPPEVSDVAAAEVAHAPPGPCYAGLRNNVSTRLMQTSLGAWPADTADFVSQRVLEEYIQGLSAAHGVRAVTQFHTRVEHVGKTGGGGGGGGVWQVRTSALAKTDGGADLRVATRAFDAVVVASGHYNAARVPNLPGLAAWKAAWPDRVRHSKGYRLPESLRGRTVLLVGGGVSAWDIAREAAPLARHVFQSARGGPYDLPASLLPENATRVGAIAAFSPPPPCTAPLPDASPLPGTVTLASGQTLCNVDCVILCTGYITSYPFLPDLHADATPMHAADGATLVTADGAMVHNLHRDIFYIPDPTLALVGVPYHVATFSLFDFQAQAVSRVFAGRARLPPEPEMRVKYTEKVLARGLGREFHSLRAVDAEQAYVRGLVAWLNADAAVLGGEPMEGHTAAWHRANSDREEHIKWLRAAKEVIKDGEEEESPGEVDLSGLC